MSNDKGGSDLDVFEGLTKKPSAKPSFPPSGPVPSKPAGPPPLTPPPGAPPGPPSLGAPPGPPPGPPRERPKTMLGIAPPPTAPLGLPPVSAPPGKPSSLPLPSRPSTLASAAAPLPPPGPPPSLRGGLPAPSRPPTGGLPPLSAPPGAAPLPAPGAPPAAAKGNSVVDMDWDDEDEKTNIYDKEETQKDLEKVGSKPLPAAGSPAPKPNLGTAAALAAGSGGAAAPASLPTPMPLPPPAPLPPPSTTRAPTPAPGSLVAAQPASRFDSTQAVQKQAGGKGGTFAVAAIAIAAVAAGGFFLMPKRGTLIVAVKSKTDGRTIESAQVMLNDRKVCEKAPCRVPEVDKGTYFVKASAPGFELGDQMVAIRAGEDSPVTIELRPTAPVPTAPVVAEVKPSGTGFKATGPAHIKVSLDGKELGPLPQEVKDSTAGPHKLRFASSDRYQADERAVTFTENKIEDLGAIRLKVLKGKATINLETTGSIVTLVSGNERRAIPQFPISIDIDTSKTWIIQAKKVGFEDSKLPISFDDGEAEKTFNIALFKKGEKKPDPPKTDPPGPGPGPGPTTTSTAEPPKVADSGTATLNINSVPPANCILDGRPLGQTPKPGVSVSAGSHTIIFVHPEKGRKSQTVTVKGGESKAVVVKF